MPIARRLILGSVLGRTTPKAPRTMPPTAAPMNGSARINPPVDRRMPPGARRSATSSSSPATSCQAPAITGAGASCAAATAAARKAAAPAAAKAHQTLRRMTAIGCMGGWISFTVR